MHANEVYLLLRRQHADDNDVSIKRTGLAFHLKTRKPAIGWAGRQNATPFDPKPSEAAFSTVFRNNFRPEVDSDVISGEAVDSISMDVRIKLDDSRSAFWQ